MTYVISPRLTIAPHAIPSPAELRAAPRSRFEEQRRRQAKGTYVTARTVDYAAVAERWREMGSVRTMAAYGALADEFGVAASAVRRALMASGAL